MTATNKGQSAINEALEALSNKAAQEAYDITVETGVTAIEQYYKHKVSQAVQKAVNDVVELAISRGNDILEDIEDGAVKTIIGLEKSLQTPDIEAPKFSLRSSRLKNKLLEARQNTTDMQLIENTSVEDWLDG